MPIFVVNNNISPFFIHKIENFPIQPAIYDTFPSHFAWLSRLIINTLYTRFCTSYIGITYKFPYKQSLYSEIPAVSVKLGIPYGRENVAVLTCETSCQYHKGYLNWRSTIKFCIFYYIGSCSNISSGIFAILSFFCQTELLKLCQIFLLSAQLILIQTNHYQECCFDSSSQLCYVIREPEPIPPCVWYKFEPVATL